jgi:hypothetical protein
MAGRSRFLRIQRLPLHSRDIVMMSRQLFCRRRVGARSVSGLIFGRNGFFSQHALTLVVLLLLLLMEHSQNRNLRALQAKTDEMIR